MPDDTSDLMLLRAQHLTAPHAFSTRGGGVSEGVYAARTGGGLNLDDREDDPRAVGENRRRLAGALGFGPAQFARLNQVHGTEVVGVDGPGVWTGDALVTRTPGVALAIGTADCFPLLLQDPRAGVIGAAHAGWKGTLGRIAQKTVAAMTDLGASPQHIRAAVGPGICGERYTVGADVARQFAAAGLGEWIQGVGVQGVGGRLHLDLSGANRAVLLEAGVPDGNIWLSGRCSTEAEFYSYRRDGGRTGRMWAVIGLPAPLSTTPLATGGGA